MAIVATEEKADSGIDIVVLGNSFEAFGVVLDFLTRHPPFAQYDLATIGAAVRLQLLRGHHVAALRGTTLVGYLGWLPTSTDVASLWMENQGPLKPVNSPQDDAFAVTVVAAEDPSCTRRLTRATRARNPGKRAFFKRQNSKRSVFNAAT